MRGLQLGTQAVEPKYSGINGSTTTMLGLEQTEVLCDGIVRRMRNGSIENAVSVLEVQESRSGSGPAHRNFMKDQYGVCTFSKIGTIKFAGAAN